MDLVKFLNLCALLFGITAIVFLSKALCPNAEEVLRGTYHYSSMGWPSVAIISDKASQKSDTLTSIILLIILLILQLCSLFANEDISFTSTRRNGAIIAIIFVSRVSVIKYGIDVGYKRSFEQTDKKLAAKNKIEYYIEEAGVPLYRDVESIALQYFDIRKNPEEDNSAFIKRFANYIGCQIPDEMDFTRFK